MIHELILHDLFHHYGLQVDQLTSIKGGWQNRLWRILTDESAFLVKVPHIEQLNAIEEA